MYHLSPGRRVSKYCLHVTERLLTLCHNVDLKWLTESVTGKCSLECCPKFSVRMGDTQWSCYWKRNALLICGYFHQRNLNFTLPKAYLLWDLPLCQRQTGALSDFIAIRKSKYLLCFHPSATMQANSPTALLLTSAQQVVSGCRGG